MPRNLLRAAVGGACLGVLCLSSFAFVPPEGEKQPGDAADAPRRPSAKGEESDYVPPIQPASDEATRSLGSFRVPSGMKSRVLAAEPLLANPVCFWIDDDGNYWVCETFRQKNAVVDNRDYGRWLLDDLAAQTVEDRAEYYAKHLGEKGLAEFSREHDRIRRLVDTDGDGKPDKETVYADGFNSPIEGTGAGVITYGGQVYYTNIPNLWQLEDTDGDGIADAYNALLTGFGVRTAFRGHDMHGLVIGPDGRLYFSIGDRGFNVVTKEGKRIAMPDTGAVFRCEPDGSNLEVYAYGLRNPQELAFDDYGNLFTGDNNSDSGDKARWVYVAQGSDSGWRMYYQYLNDRGPWNREMMWYPADSEPLTSTGPGDVPKGSVASEIQPAYILPPVANIADGPSGLTYYPGVGLPESYKGHFFLCDFRGTPGNSGVRSFAVEPNGAGFKLVDSEEFIWSILCTDADFAPNGEFVISDWVNGWNGEGKGRLYGFQSEAHLSQESAKLLAEDFSKRSPEALVDLFSNPDRRVRQKAHLELAKHPMKDWPRAEFAADKAEIAALHTVWAAGIRARQHQEPAALDLLTEAAGSNKTGANVRVAAITALAEAFWPNSGTPSLEDAGKRLSVIEQAAKDEDGRVKAAALLAYSAISAPTMAESPKRTLPDWLGMITNEKEDDQVLRHAGQLGLATMFSADTLATLANQPNVARRIDAVVALRRQQSEQVAAFLKDTEADVVTEAARAINDVPIEAATEELAAVGNRSGLTDPALRRVINANFRLGGRENAERVAAVAADGQSPAAVRLEAIAELKMWADPPLTDRVTGMYRPVSESNEKRDTAFMGDVLRPVLGGLLSGSDEVRKASIDLASTYGIKEIGPVLKEIVAEKSRPTSERVAALQGLAAVSAEDLPKLLSDAITDPAAAVRSAARRLLAKRNPAQALPELKQALEQGETSEKQAAIETLADMQSQTADTVLIPWLDRLRSGDVPAEIRLDLLEAANKRPKLQKQAQAYLASQAAKSDPVDKWSDSLVGGDAARGLDIFLNRTAVSCQRCHKVDGRGGEVGPDVTKIGSEKDRRYLLESIVNPNAKIAQGFESVVLVTIEGKVLSGVKREDTEQALTIITPEGQKIVIPKDEIEEQAAGKSGMPEDIIKHLSAYDVRDLVEFLATRTGENAPQLEE